MKTSTKSALADEPPVAPTCGRQLGKGRNVSDSNLAGMHRRIAETFGPRIALRYKQFGRYRDYPWQDYRRDADRLAAKLIEMGIQVGDLIGILSENRYEWLVADIGILSAGAADVPMHAPLAPKQVEYQLGHSEARGVIVSNQAQADKVFEVAANLPNLEFLISFEPINPQPRGARRIERISATPQRPYVRRLPLRGLPPWDGGMDR